MSSTKPPRNKVDNNDTGDAEPEKKKPAKRKVPAKQTKVSKKPKADAKLKGKKGKKKR